MKTMMILSPRLPEPVWARLHRTFPTSKSRLDNGPRPQRMTKDQRKVLELSEGLKCVEEARVTERFTWEQALEDYSNVLACKDETIAGLKEEKGERLRATEALKKKLEENMALARHREEKLEKNEKTIFAIQVAWDQDAADNAYLLSCRDATIVQLREKEAMRLKHLHTLEVHLEEREALLRQQVIRLERTSKSAEASHAKAAASKQSSVENERLHRDENSKLHNIIADLKHRLELQQTKNTELATAKDLVEENNEWLSADRDAAIERGWEARRIFDNEVWSLKKDYRVQVEMAEFTMEIWRARAFGEGTVEAELAKVTCLYKNGIAEMDMETEENKSLKARVKDLEKEVEKEKASGSGRQVVESEAQGTESVNT